MSSLIGLAHINTTCWCYMLYLLQRLESLLQSSNCILYSMLSSDFMPQHQVKMTLASVKCYYCRRMTSEETRTIMEQSCWNECALYTHLHGASLYRHPTSNKHENVAVSVLQYFSVTLTWKWCCCPTNLPPVSTPPADTHTPKLRVGDASVLNL